MVHIKKIKTWHGFAYAVVAPFTSTTQALNKNGNTITVSKTEDLPVDYKVGSKVCPAVFPATPEGLQKAKEIQKMVKNR